MHLRLVTYCICSFAAIKGEGGVHDEISLVQFHKSWYMVLKFEMYFKISRFKTQLMNGNF